VGLAARLGGDEFAVLVAGVDLCRALERAHALRRELAAAVSLLGVCVTSSVSIGVAEFAGASCSGDELIGRADVALYAAKAARSGVEAYRPADGASVARRLALATDLPGALANGGIELWYQPQARAADGRVTGFEALLRWPHPRLGMVPPPEVVAVAQRTGLMPVLTSYVLDRALRDRGAWAGAGHDLDVAVNVTPTDVLEADFAAEVEQALQQTSTPPGALVLELTETDEMDQVASLQVLTRLAARGVRISVDDFGTGYSSLAYLDRLPLHEVKIDQSFVFRLEREASAATIIRATVTLAHDLGFRVVAEGVENAATRSRVAEIGCDLVQGYELSRPMPAAEVLPWLTHHAGQPIAVAGPSSPRR
jgi:predicted signal transduction protein with EAL and GGDEF domain